MLIFIISLIVPLLISGSFFPDLIVSLSSLVFLVYVFKNKAFYYFNNKTLIIFFIFCVYCILISIFVAKDVLLSLESSLFYFRIGIFSCLIWYLIENDKKILNYFYYVFIISFLALIIDGYIQFFTGANILGIPKSSSGTRISSFFGKDLVLGSYLSRLFPLFFALFLIKKKKQLELYFMAILFFLTSALIYMSGERASFFLHILSYVFILIFIKQYKKFIIILLAVSTIIISVLSFNFSHIKNRMITDPISHIKKSFFTTQHNSLIGTAYNMFLDKPIFGHGPKMFRVICKNEKYAVGDTPCMTHPHNFYVQLLAEAGIIGFIFLLSALFYILYISYRQFDSFIKKKSRYLTDYQVCLLAGMLITVWPFTTNGNFFNNWLAIIYSLPLGFYFQTIYSKSKKKISF